MMKAESLEAVHTHTHTHTNSLKNRRGITLVALVVTIVVLLILAGVSISLVLGENGLINNAKEAKQSTQDAQKNERNAFDEIDDYVEEQNGEKNIVKVADEYPGDISDNNTRSGEENNPYVINSIEDLVAFSSNVTQGNCYEGKYIELGTDLDFNSNKSYVEPYRTDYAKYGYDGELKTLLISNIGFIPIGEEYDIDNNNFKGIFDGKGKIIYNLNIKNENIDKTLYIGMFANNQGVVRNLKLDKINVNISGIDEKYFFVGGIAGNTTGTIENCVVNGNIKVDGSFGLVAGILGRNQGTTTRCINKATISGKTMYIAGIAAQNLGELKECTNDGNINSKKNGIYVGGITGLSDLSNASIKSCYNTGKIYCNVTVSVFVVGGIVGQCQGKGMENCYNRGEISVEGENYGSIGGVVGLLSNKLVNCYSSCKITTKNNIAIGGIVGRLDQYLVKNCYADTVINSESDIKGAIIGKISEQASTTNSSKNYFYCDLEPFGSNIGNRTVDYEKLDKKPTQAQILEMINGETNEFVEDTKNINGGYPILSWQNIE